MNKFLKKIKPDIFIDDIYELDLEKIKKMGISTFIFDIDNTLVTYDDIIAPIHTKKWLTLLKDQGFNTYLISNNNENRVKKFANSVNLPYFSRALKPRKKYLKIACTKLNVNPKNVAMVGDQLFTDIYGGNRMGMLTIFVKAISDKENWFVHLKRTLERIIIKEWL